jgi:hypothetical protein
LTDQEFCFQFEGRSFNPGFDEYYLGGAKPAAVDSIAMESRNFEQVPILPKVTNICYKYFANIWRKIEGFFKKTPMF